MGEWKEKKEEGEEELTPFRPITSSDSALMHINLNPARVIPFAMPHKPISAAASVSRVIRR